MISTKILFRLCAFALFLLTCGEAGVARSMTTATVQNAVNRAEVYRVRPRFNLETPAESPFPSDRFTVLNRSHNTGRQVNLPVPDCSTRPSDCEDIDVINTLDGFNVQPRLSIPFDGLIDINSVTSETIFLIKLGNALDGEGVGGSRIGINQVVWDAATNTLHVESDALLEQHTSYALVVMRGVRDQAGKRIEPSRDFWRFVMDFHPPRHLRGYRRSLLAALRMARRAGVRSNNVAVASVFTTQSVTAMLEKMRDQIKANTPAPANFNLASDGTRTVFPLNDVTSIAWNQQTGTNPPNFNSVQVNLPFLRIIPGAVGQIAFGKYLSPDYTVHPGEYIPPVGTRTGTPHVQGMTEIYFNLYLPSSPKPANGYPVAIFGHGSSINKNTNGGPLNVAASLAAQGIATIGINVVGHGFGPLGTLTVNRNNNGSVVFPAGGRGIDQNNDSIISDREGLRAASPRTVIDVGDGLRQTVADLMQLVRIIEVGMDVDDDAQRDLNPSRIYYFGQSLGGIYGTAFLAVEPNVKAGVLNVPGGSHVELQRLSPPSGRALVASRLAARQPSLTNAPGVNSIDGVSIPGLPQFDENMPLRDGVPLTVGLADGTTRIIQSPLNNTVPGAIEIQQFLENTEWVMQPGNPVAYSLHLRKAPLDGVPAKSVIVQFAKGDQTVPNPATTAMLRAGELADRATYFRNDLVFAENPAVPKNPHGFMLTLGSPVSLVVNIARGAQEQIATFFASDGATVIHPEPARFFEVPISSELPEDLNYIP